jgi:hypothetical protein
MGVPPRPVDHPALPRVSATAPCTKANGHRLLRALAPARWLGRRQRGSEGQAHIRRVSSAPGVLLGAAKRASTVHLRRIPRRAASLAKWLGPLAESPRPSRHQKVERRPNPQAATTLQVQRHWASMGERGAERALFMSKRFPNYSQAASPTNSSSILNASSHRWSTS